LHLGFNVGNEAFPLRINLVLRVEKSAPLGVTLRLKGLDLLLAVPSMVRSL